MRYWGMEKDNKCKVGILGAKFGNHVGSVEAKALFSKVPTL